MRYYDDRHHLHVELETNQCDIPTDERARMQSGLAQLGEAVKDFPASDLRMKFIRHPRSDAYHVEARLKLPGETLFTGDQDSYLDSAFQRCIHKLVRKVDGYKAHPDQSARQETERRVALDRDVVAPEDPGAGPLGEAVRAGDYRAFRNALTGYEEWLRTRAGRWVQRYPEAQARIGRGLAIGDVVEEVYLNAFERFDRWPTEVPFHEWLEELIDLSVRLLLRKPDEEAENASLARTVREGPLE